MYLINYKDMEQNQRELVVIGFIYTYFIYCDLACYFNVQKQPLTDVLRLGVVKIFANFSGNHLC